MRQLQINKMHQSARAHRYQDDAQVLPLDPRDPDIVRAKRLQRASDARTDLARDE
jgi:hypothetical protein